MGGSIAGLLPPCASQGGPCKEASTSSCCHEANGPWQAASASGHHGAERCSAASSVWQSGQCEAHDPKSRSSHGQPVVEQIPHPSLVNQDLLRAARDGDHVRVRVALLSGADLEVRQARGSRVEDSWEASSPYRGRFQSSEKEYEDAEGLTALMYAARGGHLKVVALLLQARASANATAKGGCCALHYAAAAGRLDIATALVHCGGARCGAGDSEGRGVRDQLPRDVGLEEAVRWQALLQHRASSTSELQEEEEEEEEQDDDSETFEEAPLPPPLHQEHPGRPLVPPLDLKSLGCAAFSGARPRPQPLPDQPTPEAVALSLPTLHDFDSAALFAELPAPEEDPATARPRSSHLGRPVGRLEWTQTQRVRACI